MVEKPACRLQHGSCRGCCHAGKSRMVLLCLELWSGAKALATLIRMGLISFPQCLDANERCVLIAPGAMTYMVNQPLTSTAAVWPCWECPSPQLHGSVPKSCLEGSLGPNLCCFIKLQHSCTPRRILRCNQQEIPRKESTHNGLWTWDVVAW